MYASVGRYQQELERSPRMLEAITEYRRAGSARAVEIVAVDNAAAELRNKPIKSNDRHILALAVAGRAVVLYSTDNFLRWDFKQLPKVGGQRRAVYPANSRESKQQRFLDQRRCPKRKGGI